jgi:tight adherence protein C
MSTILVFLFTFAVFLLGLGLLPQKRVFEKTLDELEARGAHNRDPATIRKLDRFISGEQRDKLTRKIIEAGWYSVTPTRLIAQMIAYGAFGMIVALAFSWKLHFSLLITGIAAVIFALGASHLPMSRLERAREARKKQVQRALPDFLDMLTTVVQAGLSVNAAMVYAVKSAPGALGEEINAALSEIRLGKSRASALRAAADRLQQQQFTTTITAITQAERLGTNISKVLGELAEDVRNQRIMLVEEHAAKLPVKMVFPMALFMLPAIFVVIFGALVANYFTPMLQ